MEIQPTKHVILWNIGAINLFGFIHHTTNTINRPFAASDHVVGLHHVGEQTLERRRMNKEFERGDM